jgi:hypothetical protein
MPLNQKLPSLFLLLARTPVHRGYLTLPFSWSRDAGAEIPASPRGSSLLPTRGSASRRLFRSTRPSPRSPSPAASPQHLLAAGEGPQVSPWCPAPSARVSSPLAPARGRRHLGTIDHNFIRRPQLPHTPSVARPADASGPPVSVASHFPARAPHALGRPGTV